MSKTIFQRIIDKEIPANIVYEDSLTLAFHDVNPQAPVQALGGHLLWVIKVVAEKLGVDKSGYRVVANVGPDGGQSVDHLHFHILAKRPLAWPPG